MVAPENIEHGCVFFWEAFRLSVTICLQLELQEIVATRAVASTDLQDERFKITLVSIKYHKCDLLSSFFCCDGEALRDAQRATAHGNLQPLTQQKELLFSSRCLNQAVRKGWVAFVLGLFIFTLSGDWGQKQVENSWAKLAQEKLPQR